MYKSNFVIYKIKLKFKNTNMTKYKFYFFL